MKLRKLYLQAFGPFTDRVVDFGSAGKSLVLVYGPNEAGKSAMLRAISDLRFGVPVKSKDNFVHAYAEMRVGGVFLNRDGREHAFVRRKGNGVTLHLAETHDATLTATGTPAPPDLEALLTCGLSKDEYDAMFGLDHQRLRVHGDALRKGEGEIGAALFEASAGVRSISGVLDRLDQSAREFFMPGTRGKNARINKALIAFEEKQDIYKKSLVRPAQWEELFKKNQDAKADLATLEEKRLKLQDGLSRIKELRAVEPLLRTLDQTRQVLAELENATLLSADAAQERARAEAGLAAARRNAGVAGSEADRCRADLETLLPDQAVLTAAAGIERLRASAESTDAHRRELDEANVEVAFSQIEIERLASRIDSAAEPAALFACAPSPSDKAALEEKLRRAENAEQALTQHRAVLEQLTAGEGEGETPALPSAESRAALRIAQLAATRSDTILQRLTALPAELKAERRAVTAALGAVGVADAAALLEISPLPDSEIDEAKSSAERYKERCDAFDARRNEIAEALSAEIIRRDQLLAGGRVPTVDDVRSARTHRDLGWSLIRGTYIEATHPAIEVYSEGKYLPEVYEQAVQHADALADAVARDTARAAQLQGCLRTIERLEKDRDERTRLHTQEAEEAQAREEAWARRLREMRLPAMTPGELRERQTKLVIARQAVETLQQKRDEEDAARATERALVADLRAAITGIGAVSQAGDLPLRTLAAIADDIEEEIKQRETKINTAAGEKKAREQHRKQIMQDEQKCAEELRSAQEALVAVFARLLLPKDSSPAPARARLHEFDALLAAKEKCDVAEAKATRSLKALEALDRQAQAIARALGDPPVADFRLYVDRLTARLEEAYEIRNQHARREQAFENASHSLREHTKTAAEHEQTLTVLCERAGVTDVLFLPEAEDRSRRKREAQAAFDHTRAQLADASRHSVDRLRAMLENQDVARMDADEEKYAAESRDAESRLREAREHEERTRRALEAIDGADTAAAAREGMEQAAAAVRSNIGPWMRSRLAHRILAKALRSFRERAQGPMLEAGSTHFARMTGGEFVRLISDDDVAAPILLAKRSDGLPVKAEEMSEGTRDQLFLALWLAALRIRRDAGVDLPVILDDVLMTSDDKRAALMLEALADFSKGGQVLVFTHHEHLLDVARSRVSADVLHTVML